MGYTIGQIEEATYIQEEIESELHNIMCVERNPSDDELKEALYQYQIYCPRRPLMCNKCKKQQEKERYKIE